MKSSIQKLENSIEFTQCEDDTLKEQVKEKSKKHATDMELLQQKVAELQLKLKEGLERHKNLEQYTRRENIRFNKIPESEDENCKAIIYDVISSLGVKASESRIRFHAVHRARRKAEGRCRPIIARFVCREDRDRVWLERGKVKHATTYTDADITEDYARAIQGQTKGKGNLARKDFSSKYISVPDHFITEIVQIWTKMSFEDTIKSIEHLLSSNLRHNSLVKVGKTPIYLFICLYLFTYLFIYLFRGIQKALDERRKQISILC